MQHHLISKISLGLIAFVSCVTLTAEKRTVIIFRVNLLKCTLGFIQRSSVT